MPTVKELNVNGGKRSIDADPKRSLLSVLRDDLDSPRDADGGPGPGGGQRHLPGDRRASAVAADGAERVQGSLKFTSENGIPGSNALHGRIP